MTAREFTHYLAGHARALHRETLLNAWYSAAFARAKKLPKLKALLKSLDGKKPVKRMSLEAQVAFAEMMNAALGGKDLRKH